MSEGEEVYLCVYDVSGGLAASLSPALLGRQIDGIWHTAIVVFGKEYFFGSGGIGIAEPGSVAGEPLQKLKLGVTYIPLQVFEEYVSGLAESEFRGDAYNLLKHNCNNFSDTLSQFLVGSGIPSHILSLPDDIINTPFGSRILPLIEQFATNSPVFNRIRREISPEFLQLNSDIEAARRHSLVLKEKRNAIIEKLAKRERKKNKKRKKDGER